MDAAFGVFLRCRPLLRGEVLQGRARYPHREDTGFSCLRIGQEAVPEARPLTSVYVGLPTTVSVAAAAPAAVAARTTAKAGRAAQKSAAETLLQQPAQQSFVAAPVYVLDPDAVLGPAVRCCPLHNPSMQQRPPRCIFERGFRSDGVFGPASSNRDVYDAVVRPLIDERAAGALYGKSATVFAFGVTSSGKSWSIFGSNNGGSAGGGEPGIVEYAVRELCDVSFFAAAAAAPGAPQGSGAALSATPAAATTTTVHVSFVEIYNERVIDLLAVADSTSAQTTTASATGTAPQFVTTAADYARQILALPPDAHVVELVDHPARGTVLANATEMLVTSERHVQALLALGRSRRTTASTAANERSSRSHAVVTLAIARRQRSSSSSSSSRGGSGSGDTCTARLTFVDLAGSERSDASVFAEIAAIEARSAMEGGSGGDASPARAHTSSSNSGAGSNAQRERAALASERLRREGSNINRSLFALGACIAALAKQSAGRAAGWPEERVGAIVVPYRNSKLTRLLRDSLGGNTRTVILATVSPSVLSYSETLATLRFAETARTVSRRSAVRANRGRDASGDAMREGYRQQLQALQQEVAQLRNVTSLNAAKIARDQQQQRQQQRDQKAQQQPPKTKAPSATTSPPLQPFPEMIPQQPPPPLPPPSAQVRTLKSFLLEEPLHEDDEIGPREQVRSQQPQRRRSPSVTFVQDAEAAVAPRQSVSVATAAHSYASVSQPRRSVSAAPETVVAEQRSPRSVSPPLVVEKKDRDAPVTAPVGPRRGDVSSAAIKLCDIMLKGSEEAAAPAAVPRPAWLLGSGGDCPPRRSIFLQSPVTAAAAERRHADAHAAPVAAVPSWMAPPAAASPPSTSPRDGSKHAVLRLTSPFVAASASVASPPQVAAAPPLEAESTPLLRVKAILARELQLRNASSGSWFNGAPRFACDL